jgi:hypothetical protein
MGEGRRRERSVHRPPIKGNKGSMKSQQGLRKTNGSFMGGIQWGIYWGGGTNTRISQGPVGETECGRCPKVVGNCTPHKSTRVVFFGVKC